VHTAGKEADIHRLIYLGVSLAKVAGKARLFCLKYDKLAEIMPASSLLLGNIFPLLNHRSEFWPTLVVKKCLKFGIIVKMKPLVWFLALILAHSSSFAQQALNPEKKKP
ncbi:MAG: hypothetical protein D6730_09825, partial [Bacteroidetes bacterium]